MGGGAAATGAGAGTGAGTPLDLSSAAFFEGRGMAAVDDTANF